MQKSWFLLLVAFVFTLNTEARLSKSRRRLRKIKKKALKKTKKHNKKQIDCLKAVHQDQSIYEQARAFTEVFVQGLQQDISHNTKIVVEYSILLAEFIIDHTEGKITTQELKECAQQIELQITQSLGYAPPKMMDSIWEEAFQIAQSCISQKTPPKTIFSN